MRDAAIAIGLTTEEAVEVASSFKMGTASYLFEHPDTHAKQIASEAFKVAAETLGKGFR